MFATQEGETTATEDSNSNKNTASDNASSDENKSSADSNGFGPVPPSDTDFDEAEIAKAEEFK